MNDSVPATNEPTGSDPGLVGEDQPAPSEVDATVYASESAVRRGAGLPERTQGDSTVAGFAELENREIGDFRILRRLGVGGMAEVYLAEQISLTRKVALKVLRADVLSGSDDIRLERFDREARAAAKLTHQNIVQVHGVGEDDGLHWIAQEYVRGLNLKQFMNRKGPPDAAVAIRFAKQIALALRAAGEAGIVHRDVKPENVMITPKGRVKVADFGLAQLARDEAVHLTQDGTTLGTPLYMSPEQVHGKPTDGRSDLYSFGVTLFHVLAGEPPFRGESAVAIAVKHLHDEPPPLHERRGDLPGSLCRLVHRLMEKDPTDRPADAGEVYEELKRIGRAIKDASNGEEVDPIDRPSRETSSWWTGARKRNAVRHGITFGIAFLSVVVVSAFVGWMMRPVDPRTTPPAAPSIAREATFDDQMWLALRLQTEEAWQAVIDEYGDDPSADRRELAKARIRLGVHALSDRRFEEAGRRFNEVYAEHESDPGLRANALAGSAAVASLTGEHWTSHQIVASVQPFSDKLDREMRQIVEETIRRNRRELGNSVEDGLEDLFRSDPESEFE